MDQALLYNRKLWSIFLSSATDKGNPLPPALRQNIANLGIFVMKQTLTVNAEPKPVGVSSLIEINRNVASGLLGRV